MTSDQSTAPKQDTPDLAAIIEIENSEINVDQIMERIRADAQRLRAQYGDGSDLPTYRPTSAGDAAGADLDQHLRRAQATYDKLYVEMIVTRRNWLSDFPPFAIVRRALHGLILFYVNALASKQTLFNTPVIHALNRLAERQNTQISKNDLVTLQDTIHQLEQRVNTLEEQLTAQTSKSS
jgi:hypothetical protein